jgi:hypothetical protein
VINQILRHESFESAGASLSSFWSDGLSPQSGITVYHFEFGSKFKRLSKNGIAVIVI